MTIDGDDSTPEAPHEAGSDILRPRGAASYLEEAVEILRPASVEERAADRRQLASLAVFFLQYVHRAENASLVSEVRGELRRLAKAADAALASLDALRASVGELSPAARRELEHACFDHAHLRKVLATAGHKMEPSTTFDRLPRLEAVPQLEDELAVVAGLSERALLYGSLDCGGGPVNTETRIHGTPLRFLAVHAAVEIDAYRGGERGRRARPHLRVSGFPGAQVYELTRTIAAYALGEEPGADLGKIVERGVADWRAQSGAFKSERPARAADKAWWEPWIEEIKRAVADTDERTSATHRGTIRQENKPPRNSRK